MIDVWLRASSHREAFTMQFCETYNMHGKYVKLCMMAGHTELYPLILLMTPAPRFKVTAAADSFENS